MKKLFLTSAIAVCFTLPAFAEGFPGNGYMLENKTYDNAATYANMGVYSDSVDATADYTNNEYTVNAGQYLPAASETVTECPANSFCPGLTGPTYYDADNAQGATACSTLTGGYNSSAAGATTETDCYKACTTSNVAHSTAVSGNDYYGAGVDTCSATGCENGYHVTEPLNLNTTIGHDSGTEYVYIGNSGSSGSYSGNGVTATYGLTDNNSFAVDYGNNGVITGHGLCSTQSGIGSYGDNAASEPAQISTSNNLTPEFGTGTNCWCNLDGYTPVNGTSQSLLGPWVFFRNTGSSPSFCASNCSSFCALHLLNTGPYYYNFRVALLGSAVSAAPATCEANTINITWSDASADDIAANNAGTCTYGGDIRTPVAAAVKPGKTFVGWKFQKPSGD